MQLDLPSGLVLEARKIEGHELVALAQRAETSEGSDLTDILKGCFKGIIDPGSYRGLVAGAAQPDWKRVLKGDVFAALFHLRRASVPDGDEYTFAVKCEECARRYEWSVYSLSKDLPVRPLPETSKAALAEGRFLEAKTLSGVNLMFRLMTPADDEPAKRLMRTLKRKSMCPVEILASRAASIDGIPGAERDINKRWNFFKGLPLDEILDLLEQFDAAECGIDMEIRTRCHGVDGCGWEQDIVLPLRRTFFSPRKKVVEKPAPGATEPPSSSDSFSPG